jgi:hypothetical protein
MGTIIGDFTPAVSGGSHLGVSRTNLNKIDNFSTVVPFGNIHQLSGVFHNLYGQSGVIRLGTSGFEFSTDGGKTFVGTATVGGNNGDVLFNDGGSIGGDSLGLTFNQSIDALGVSGELQLGRKTLDRTAIGPRAGSGVSRFVAMNLAERPIFGGSNSGMNLPYFFQPALFNKFIFMALPSVTTTIQTYGNTLTSVGTVSHPTPNVESGVMVNIASAATAAATCGTGSNSTLFCRGATSGVNTGFFYATRITQPDANFDAGRIFCGLVAGSMASSVSADDPGVDSCGFSFSTTQNVAKNWLFSTKDGTTRSTQDTGISCSGNRIWDMYIYSPPFPNNNVLYWTLHDVSWNRIANGYAINNLPRVNVLLRAGIQLNNITASVRNLRFTHIYCESL